jgi:hypothetical protein
VFKERSRTFQNILETSEEHIFIDTDIANCYGVYAEMLYFRGREIETWLKLFFFNL